MYTYVHNCRNFPSSAALEDLALLLFPKHIVWIRESPSMCRGLWMNAGSVLQPGLNDASSYCFLQITQVGPGWKRRLSMA